MKFGIRTPSLRKRVYNRTTKGCGTSVLILLALVLLIAFAIVFLVA